jgi:phytoene dehydrogenase-like protein
MIAIVGAGLAGLTAGRALLNVGFTDFVIYEREAQVGGRLATESDHEFQYDVGFAVLNPAYPMVTKYLSLPELGLKYFDAGALLLRGKGQSSALFDPLSHPDKLLPMIAQSFPTWSDRLRTLALRILIKPPQRPRDDGISALDGLHSRGFSESYIEQFFRPFFAGVFLDRELSVSDELFRYLFNYFRESRVALPAGGINAVAVNLASSISPQHIRCGVAVESIENGKLTLSDGTVVTPRTTILAVDARSAAKLTAKSPDDCEFRSVTTAYFAAPSVPWSHQRLLALNSTGKGWVNHMAALSNVQPSYAKGQRHLVAVSGVGPVTTHATAKIAEDIQRELVDLLGHEALNWEFLRVYPVAQALPVRFGRVNYESADGLIYAGDYIENPSIQGAMLSGERAASLALRRIK